MRDGGFSTALYFSFELTYLSLLLSASIHSMCCLFFGTFEQEDQ